MRAALQVGAAPLTAELGYLVSARRMGMYRQGAFEISCVGCQCVSVGAPAGGALLFPFPEVQTNASFSLDVSFERLNATVTATTSFLILWRASVPCHITLTHTLGLPRTARSMPLRKRAAQAEPSRIRIDSLFVRAMTLKEYSYHLMKVPSWTWRRMLAELASEERFSLGNRSVCQRGGRFEISKGVAGRGCAKR